MAVMKPNVAIANPDLVGESFFCLGMGVVQQSWQRREVVLLSWVEVGFSLGREALTGGSQELIACFPWGVFILVHPCAAEGVQDRDQVQGGGGLASSLQVKRRYRLCQGQDPYGQRYMGTHHVGCNGRKLLAVVPNSACSINVGEATKLVGFVHQLPGKSLCEQPSGKAVVANNIAVPPVGKDALSLSNTQFTPLFPSACHVIVPKTGAEAPAKRCCHCRFGYHGLHSKGGNGGNLWSVDEETVTNLGSCCLMQGRCLERHCNQKRCWK
jgi:hypothetical protein